MSEYVTVKNAKTNNVYKIAPLKTYKIEQSLDVPADMFSFSLGDHASEISKAISAGDQVDFFINNNLALKGIIDNMDIFYSLDSNDINIAGRDLTALLIDNDAEPKTYNNLTLKQYINNRVNTFGITKVNVTDNSKIKKIEISSGESEWAVIERLANDKGLYPRFEIDTIICSKLRADTKQNYRFSNDISNAIKIKDMHITLSNNIKNEVIVYSEDFENNRNIKGTAKDNNLKINKKLVINNSDIESTSEANKIAKEELIKHNRDAFSIRILIDTKQIIKVNHIARVTVKKLNLDCYMLIDKVIYTKSISEGSQTEVSLKLIEGNRVSWNNHNIPTLPKA